jgi:hypothetical protein
MPIRPSVIASFAKPAKHRQRVRHVFSQADLVFNQQHTHQ